jgi:hypothetical protein
MLASRQLTAMDEEWPKLVLGKKKKKKKKKKTNPMLVGQEFKRQW